MFSGGNVALFKATKTTDVWETGSGSVVGTNNRVITWDFFHFIVAATWKQFCGLRVEKSLNVCSSYTILYEIWSVNENKNNYLLLGIIVDLLKQVVNSPSTLYRLICSFTGCCKCVSKWFPVWADTGNISIHAELCSPPPSIPVRYLLICFCFL